MSAPAFSVVVPAYNAAQTIGPTIQSVLAQTQPSFELLVVDDGSTDQTPHVVTELAARDPRIVLLRQPNRGLPAARNAAMSAAIGDYVSFLDADDLWLPDYLSAVEQALTEDPAAGLAYTDAWVLDEVSRRVSRRPMMAPRTPPEGVARDSRTLLAQLLRGNFIFVSATVPRAVLAEVGQFDVRLAAAEDYEFWLRIVAHGYRVVRVGGLLAVYRYRPGSMSTNMTAMAEAVHQVYQTVAEEYDVPESARADARARMAVCREELTALRRPQPPSRFRAARRRLGRFKRRLLWPARFFVRTPPAVRLAFPDLRAL